MGTGGARLYNEVQYLTREPNSEAFSDASKGILKIRLFADRYDWAFVPIEGHAAVPLPVRRDVCAERVTP